MAILPILSEFVHAQEIVTLNGFPTLKNAVARQYTADRSVYYCEDEESRYFVLYDLSTPTSVIVSQFPSFLNVNDFEVFDDTVFFCGTFPQSGNPYGFVGQISVQDLFYNNALYNFGVIDNIPIPSCPLNPHLTACYRMDVFRDGGHVHFAVVGELEHSLTYGTALRRTACDIWFNGSDWVGEVLFQKEDYYKTSDITCTNNHVVVSAYDDDKNYSILLVFNKTTDFPSYPIAINSFRIKDRRYDDNILVERLKDNDVAVSHYYEEFGAGRYGTAVHYINDVSTLPTPLSHFSLHYLHGTNQPISILRDMRYCGLFMSDALLLLHDIDNPLWVSPTSTIFEFEAYNLPLMTAQAWHASDNVSLFSVDNRVFTPLFSLVGNHNIISEPMLTLKTSGTKNCFDARLFTYNDVTADFSTGPLDTETLGFTISPRYIFPPNPTNYTCEIRC